MQTVIIESPGKVSIQDRPVPVPAAGEVQIRVSYVGLCGSDLNTFRGLNPMVTYPRVPGHEISGVIAAVGSGVPDPWRPGMTVTVSPYSNCGICPACRRQRPNCCRANQTLGVQRDGALTEFIVVPWQKLFHSARLGPRDLVLVEPLTVGAHAVARGEVTAADVVCVLGCGAIGLGAVAAAAFRQATVIAVDIDDAKLRIARAAGAGHVVNSARDDLLATLAALTGGDGPNVVVEAIGLPATFRAAVDAVAFAGRVVYVGYAKETVAYETKVFVQKELDIRGSRNAQPEDFAGVMRLLEADRFPVEAVVSRVCPLAATGSALADWSAAPAAFTKILVQVRG